TRTALQPRESICCGVIICANNSFSRDLYGSAPLVAMVNSSAAAHSSPALYPPRPEPSGGVGCAPVVPVPAGAPALPAALPPLGAPETTPCDAANTPPPGAPAGAAPPKPPAGFCVG